MDLMALVIYKGVARRVLLPISSEKLAERFGYEGQENWGYDWFYWNLYLL